MHVLISYVAAFHPPWGTFSFFFHRVNLHLLILVHPVLLGWSMIHWDDTEQPNGPQNLQAHCGNCCVIMTTTLFESMGMYTITLADMAFNRIWNSTFKTLSSGADIVRMHILSREFEVTPSRFVYRRRQYCSVNMLKVHFPQSFFSLFTSSNLSTAAERVLQNIFGILIKFLMFLLRFFFFFLCLNCQHAQKQLDGNMRNRRCVEERSCWPRLWPKVKDGKLWQVLYILWPTTIILELYISY